MEAASGASTPKSPRTPAARLRRAKSVPGATDGGVGGLGDVGRTMEASNDEVLKCEMLIFINHLGKTRGKHEEH